MPSVSELQPWLAPYAAYLLRVAEFNHLRPQLTSVYRSRARQETLYRRYLSCQRSGGSCLPAAPPGFSDHERRTAFDMIALGGYREPQQLAALTALGQLWQSWGGRWSSRDPVHFYV